MKYSLAKSIFQLFDQTIHNDLNEILLKKSKLIQQNKITENYCSQVILIVEHIRFTLKLKNIFQKQNQFHLKQFKFRFISFFFNNNIYSSFSLKKSN